jgi:hypothetical protein
MAAAGVEETAHGLRHTLATRLVRDHGCDLALVADVLGHADVKTTRRYARSELEDRRAALEALGRSLVWLGSSRPYVGCGQACSSAESRRAFGASPDDRVSSRAGASEQTLGTPASVRQRERCPERGMAERRAQWERD